MMNITYRSLFEDDKLAIQKDFCTETKIIRIDRPEDFLFYYDHASIYNIGIRRP